MLDETKIKDALHELGYRRLRRFVYKATWSTSEVEHLLYFWLWGKPKDFFTADFGVRNLRAQAFAFKSVVAYGGKLHQLAQYNERSDCFMRFSLGQLASWKPRSSLLLNEMSEGELVAKIKSDVQNHLFPLVRSVLNIRSLLDFLINDNEPISWFYTNRAYRAAMIVSLAGEAGLDAHEITNLLQPYSKDIARGLSKAPNPDAFIRTIIDDARA